MEMHYVRNASHRPIVWVQTRRRDETMKLKTLCGLAFAGGLLIAALFSSLGCQGTDFETLVGVDENQVYRNEIAAILNDDELDVFEKDQALEELGIDDPLLRQHMIDNPNLYS